MKKLCFVAICILFSLGLSRGQGLARLSLQEAYAALEKQYPLLSTDSLVDRIYQKELDKLTLGKRPDLFLKADARIQSETVSFPEDVGIPIAIDLPLYSAKSYLELNYSLFDGGLYKAQVDQKKADWELEKKSLEVEAYSLRQRIDRLFVGISLYRAQAKLLEISQQDVAARRKVLEAGLANGVVLESEVSRLKVRELELAAQKQEIAYSISGSLSTLADLTGLELAENIDLDLPVYEPQLASSPVQRPEQELFLLQKASLLQKESLLEVQRRPRVQLFAQGGAGAPNPLNFFDNNLSPYGLAGVSFQWKLSDRKQLAHDKEILYLRSQQIEKQKESFEFNIDAADANYRAEVESLAEQISKDEEIAALQAEILSQLATQLENGIITSADYLIQSNAELRARQKLELHKIQLQQKYLDYRTRRGLDR